MITIQPLFETTFIRYTVFSKMYLFFSFNFLFFFFLSFELSSAPLSLLLLLLLLLPLSSMSYSITWFRSMKAIKVHRYDNEASPPKMRERLQFPSSERRLRTKRFSSVLRTNGEWSWHRDRSLAHSLGQRSSWPIARDTRKTIHQLGQPFSALHHRGWRKEREQGKYNRK